MAAAPQVPAPLRASTAAVRAGRSVQRAPRCTYGPARGRRPRPYPPRGTGLADRQYLHHGHGCPASPRAAGTGGGPGRRDRWWRYWPDPRAGWREGATPVAPGAVPRPTPRAQAAPVRGPRQYGCVLPWPCRLPAGTPRRVAYWRSARAGASGLCACGTGPEPTAWPASTTARPAAAAPWGRQPWPAVAGPPVPGTASAGAPASVPVAQAQGLGPRHGRPAPARPAAAAPVGQAAVASLWLAAGSALAVGQSRASGLCACGTGPEPTAWPASTTARPAAAAPWGRQPWPAVAGPPVPGTASAGAPASVPVAQAQGLGSRHGRPAPARPAAAAPVGQAAVASLAGCRGCWLRRLPEPAVRPRVGCQVAGRPVPRPGRVLPAARRPWLATQAVRGGCASPALHCGPPTARAAGRQA